LTATGYNVSAWRYRSSTGFLIKQVMVTLRLEQIWHFKRSQIFIKGKSAPSWERSLDRVKRAVWRQDWHEQP
jgi:hypothetical protein